MYARVNTIFGRQDRIAAGVARAEGTDRAAVEATNGNRGLTTLMNSEAGVLVAVSYWDDLIHSSAPALTRVRERVATAAGGDLVAESFAVAWTVPGPTTAWPGATVRMDRLQVDAAASDAEERSLYTQIREMRFSRGFCGAEFLIDRVGGPALLVSSWTSDGEVARMDVILARLRDTSAAASRTVHRRTETYVLVRGRAPI